VEGSVGAEQPFDGAERNFGGRRFEATVLSFPFSFSFFLGIIVGSRAKGRSGRNWVTPAIRWDSKCGRTPGGLSDCVIERTEHIWCESSESVKIHPKQVSQSWKGVRNECGK
jgi:hypothetical protein